MKKLATRKRESAKAVRKWTARRVIADSRFTVAEEWSRKKHGGVRRLDADEPFISQTLREEIALRCRVRRDANA